MDGNEGEDDNTSFIQQNQEEMSNGQEEEEMMARDRGKSGSENENDLPDRQNMIRTSEKHLRQ